MSHATILLVDDEAPLRDLVSEMLTRDGHRVVGVRSGRRALEIARQHTPPIDVLVTDVVMKPMDGLELADRLTARCPAVKVLLMSGYADAARIRAAVSRTGRTFLPKPFTPKELRAAVAALLSSAGGDTVAPPRPAACPACGEADAVEVIGIAIGHRDSAWRGCGRCDHLWSVGAGADVFPLLVGSPVRRAVKMHERELPRFDRAERYRVHLPARCRAVGAGDAWHRGVTDNVSRNGILLQMDDPGVAARLIDTDRVIEIEVEIDVYPTPSSEQHVRCRGYAVRLAPIELIDDQPALAVAVHSYALDSED